MGSKKQKKKNNDNTVSIMLIVGIVLIGAVVSLLLILGDSGCSCEGDGKYVASEDDKYALDDFEKSSDQTDYVKITVKGYGSMIVELYPDTAPITVANFKKLVSEKFYDGLTFHRIVKDFMIQGGDPLGTGSGGSDETIKGEFSLNGVENNLSHTRGVISMARSSSYDSASSQFFICDADSTYLDGSYAAFGKVVSGYTVLDKIADTDVTFNSSGTEQSVPTSTVKITSISFVNLVK